MATGADEIDAAAQVVQLHLLNLHISLINVRKNSTASSNRCVRLYPMMKHSCPYRSLLHQDVNPPSTGVTDWFNQYVKLIWPLSTALSITIFKTPIEGLKQHWSGSPYQETLCWFMLVCHPSAVWFHCFYSFAVSLLRLCSHVVISPPTHMAFKTKSPHRWASFGQNLMKQRAEI